MRRHVDLFIPLAITAVLFMGCPSAVTHVPGDDAVIADATAAERNLFESANTLFTLEKDHPELEALVPGVHAYAESMRYEVPRTLQVLRTDIQIYRQTTAQAGPKPNIQPVIDQADEEDATMQAWLQKIALAGVK